MNKPETNLWLDDERPCPFVGNWLVAKNYDEAVEILTNYHVVKCFLDHDLSFEHYVPGAYHLPEVYNNFTEKTGYDVVKWIEEYEAWPAEPPIVHSLNPVGARRMATVLARHYDCRPEQLLQPYRKPQ
jgi:hypothetical protein